MRCLFLFFFLAFQLNLLAFDLSKMSLEEKIGQLFMVYFDGDTINENSKKLIKKAHIGGVVLYNWANKLDNPKQIKTLCEKLQKSAILNIKIPLFIAIDQECGLVNRLENGFTEFPANAALGQTKQAEFAFKVARYIGKEIKNVGINFNLAPVVDVNNNPKNPLIGIRSYGDNPKLVTQFARKAVEGYQNVGVIPCLKHFPGHGDVTTDSHESLPVVLKSLEQLLECELYPYKHLALDVPAIMTAHILFPQLDPDNCATLSSIILKKILREKLNFQGLIISDSLVMKGVLNCYDNLEQVIFKAIEAGNDILLIGGRGLKNRIDGEVHVNEILKIFRKVVRAVKNGLISEDRINDSVMRILILKEKFKLHQFPFSTKLNKTLKIKKHQELAREISKQALFIKDWHFQDDLSSKNILLIAPKIIKNKLKTSRLYSLGKVSDSYFFKDLEPTAQECKEISDLLPLIDIVVFCSYNAWKWPLQHKLLNQLANTKPTICIATCDPYDLNIVNNSMIKIATFSPSKCSFEVTAKLLNEKANFNP
jgi:beta-N-acetylhexosaminidase